MIPTNKDFNDLFGYGFDLNVTIPHSTPEAGQPIIIGTVRGVPIGSDFYFPPDLIGKTLSKTDSSSTTTTQVDYKFKSTDFMNPDKPLLSEIVAVLNSASAWDEATDTDAAANLGCLKVTAAASGAATNLTIGGTAAPIFGFGPGDGITVQQKTDATSGVVVTFPAYFAGKLTAGWAYSRNPKVTAGTSVIASGIVTPPSTAVTYSWTPSTRVLLFQCAAAPGTTNSTRLSVRI